MQTKYDAWLEYIKSSRQSLKVNNATFHLKLLDNFLNVFGGKILMSLYGDWIEKVKLECVGIKKQHQDFESYYRYGHVNCGTTKETSYMFRLSTCLNKNGTITIPLYEYKHFKLGNFFLFTTGDLFLIVDIKKVYNKFKNEDLRKVGPVFEQTGNYVIPISWLFENNFIDKFGFLSDNIITEGTLQTKYNLSTKKLPKNFTKIKLRGCLNGNEIKFILAKIANADQKEYFEYLIFTSVKAILKYAKTCNIKTWQGLRKQAKTNTKNLEDMIIPRKRSLVKYNGINCLLFYNSDIEKIRK